MSISLKNRFRPTLDALEDRFMPSAVGTGLIHHRPHHGHEVHHRPGRTIEVHHHRGGEQEMHTGADDNGGTGGTGGHGADDTGGQHSGGHA